MNGKFNIFGHFKNFIVPLLLPAIIACQNNSPSPDQLSDLDKQMISSIKKNDVSEIRRITKSGLYPNGKYMGANTPLEFSICKGSIDASIAILDALDSISGPLERGMTPLAMAAVCNRTDVVAILLERGVDPNRRMIDGSSALFLSAQENSVETAKMIIDAGADLNATDSLGWTVMLIAAQNDNAELIKILHEKGNSVNDVIAGVTPLYIATSNKSVNAVRMLVDLGADPDKTGKLDESPIEMARQEGLTEIENILLKGRNKNSQ
jgi:ankyrin repeat protein